MKPTRKPESWPSALKAAEASRRELKRWHAIDQPMTKAERQAALKAVEKAEANVRELMRSVIEMAADDIRELRPAIEKLRQSLKGVGLKTNFKQAMKSLETSVMKYLKDCLTKRSMTAGEAEQAIADGFNISVANLRKRLQRAAKSD
jgi:hypothetical protein